MGLNMTIMPSGQDVRHQMHNAETELFTRRLNALQEIVTALLTNSGYYQSGRQMFEAELRNLECKLNALAQNVVREGSLNAGGKFEWIDSVLVKVCLRNTAHFNLITLFETYIYISGTVLSLLSSNICGRRGHLLTVTEDFYGSSTVETLNYLNEY
jgi:hypothetical protein